MIFEKRKRFCASILFLLLLCDGASIRTTKPMQAAVYGKKFDRYGIKNEYTLDPAWAQLSSATKQEIKDLKNGITFFNNYLAMRHQDQIFRIST